MHSAQYTIDLYICYKQRILFLIRVRQPSKNDHIFKSKCQSKLKQMSNNHQKIKSLVFNKVNSPKIVV